MLNQFSRTQLLIGDRALEKLHQSHVAVFGIGGVGSYAAEALCRSGVGSLTLFDDDKICLTNLNRQLPATRDTVGRLKTQVMAERLKTINKNVNITVNNCFYLPENADLYPLHGYDYVLDAVDTVTAKLELICRCKEAGVNIISCMGAGNKLSAQGFVVDDIYNTRVCPLAKVMRRELKSRAIFSLKVVYSQEPPLKTISSQDNSCRNNCVCPSGTQRNCNVRRQIPGSMSYVPAVAGLIAAGEIITDLIAGLMPQNLDETL